jgi:hypothetical protein
VKEETMSKEETQRAEEEALKRTFAGIVAKLDAGRLNAEATDDLRDLAGTLYQHAHDHAKAKGKLVLTLDFAAEDNGTVTITGAIKVTKPKTHHARTIMWVAPGNNLVDADPERDDAKQTRMFKGAPAEGKPRSVEDQPQAPRGV